MPGKNVDTFREAHQNFNARKLDAVLSKVAENCTYHDRARRQTFKGRNGFKEFMEGWITAFSNAKIVDPHYIDAGDTVISQYTARGTQDGPLGSLPKSGREINMQLCEICTFNEKGEIVSGTTYYDQLTMLTQLGFVEEAAASSAGGRNR